MAIGKEHEIFLWESLANMRWQKTLGFSGEFRNMNADSTKESGFSLILADFKNSHKKSASALYRRFNRGRQGATRFRLWSPTPNNAIQSSAKEEAGFRRERLQPPV
jgi:hypothetical protein